MYRIVDFAIVHDSEDAPEYGADREPLPPDAEPEHSERCKCAECKAMRFGAAMADLWARG